MARIVGAIATSHTPTIGFALDRKLSGDPVWQPIFDAYKPVRQWLEARKPDVLLTIYNDHVTAFFFDHYSAFGICVADRSLPAGEGGGARQITPLAAHAPLVRALGTSLMAHDLALG